MMALLCINCATKPEKTGLALGELRGGVVHILRCAAGTKTKPPADIATDWLRHYDDALIALDAPLGWPRALENARQKLGPQERNITPVAHVGRESVAHPAFSIYGKK